MTYSSTLTEFTKDTATIPKSCLAGAACSALETQLKTRMGVTAAMCTDDGTNCNCNIAQNVPAMESGTYTMSGATVNTTPTSGAAGSAQYCVSGNQISFSANDPMSPMLVLIGAK
jgi:hypothetical protein